MALRCLHRLITVLFIVAAATHAVGQAPVVYAEPQVWDIENYDECMAAVLAQYQMGKITFQQFHEYALNCCESNGGIWSASQETCVAPPADSQGSQQLPGNIQIPSDIASAPPVTRVPLRPLPPDIANAPAVTTVTPPPPTPVTTTPPPVP